MKQNLIYFIFAKLCFGLIIILTSDGYNIGYKLSTFKIYKHNNKYFNARIDLKVKNKISTKKPDDYEIIEKEEDVNTNSEIYLLYTLPFVIPMLGYLLFDPISTIIHNMILILGNKNWVVVDGGQYNAALLTPAINGVVIPTISIALATLVAGTISSLHDRQNVIRSCINKEACDIKQLYTTLQYMCKDASLKQWRDLLSLLYRYLSRLIKESLPTDVDNFSRNINEWSAADSELQSMLRYIYQLDNSAIDSNTISSIKGLLTELNYHRSNRLTVLQNEYPIIHWGVIALLETDQDTIKFLDGIQLKILFSFLMGAVSSTALLCFDLSQPFKYGFFSISSCVDQLKLIRKDIEVDLLDDLKSDKLGNIRKLTTMKTKDNTIKQVTTDIQKSIITNNNELHL